MSSLGVDLYLVRRQMIFFAFIISVDFMKHGEIYQAIPPMYFGHYFIMKLAM